MVSEGIVVTGEERTIELLNLGVCPSPVAVAIGAGGSAFNGGAGSGQVDFSTNLPQGAYIKLTAHPGRIRPAQVPKNMSLVSVHFEHTK